MRVLESIEITAPPEKIWSFMTEPEKVLQWYIPLQKFEYTTDQLTPWGHLCIMRKRQPLALSSLTAWLRNG